MTWSQSGAWLMGKNTPARKINGKIRSCMRSWNPCCDRMKLAITSPSPDRAMDRMKTTGMRRRMIDRSIFTPTTGAISSMTETWSRATTHAPRAFPSTIPVRPSGATSSSRRNPNSRSHTIETPANREVVSTPMAMIPGYMNWMKSTPGATEPMRLPNPAPKMTRKISGWANEPTRRDRSFTNRSSSR